MPTLVPSLAVADLGLVLVLPVPGEHCLVALVAVFPRGGMFVGFFVVFYWCVCFFGEGWPERFGIMTALCPWPLQGP